ncbi:hypothetical protein [Niabella soli]|uniref:Uncharacterized protein n=1 Tax=Niabella soli DSM 19437 TaxID=929713 RepID=W0F565_9BACT|nr:hypothetical protein [Niabella soli]AHF16943.1 hypothetical protein NIASO_20605 [Niabella soli DSM 19437]
MKRKITSLLLLLLLHMAAIACAVCERNQPRVLKGITHGAGPNSRWDYLIVWTAVVIVLATLFLSIKWLIRPGEQSGNHIKRSILNNP